MLERERVVVTAFLTALSDLHQIGGVGGGVGWGGGGEKSGSWAMETALIFTPQFQNNQIDVRDLMRGWRQASSLRTGEKGSARRQPKSSMEGLQSHPFCSFEILQTPTAAPGSLARKLESRAPSGRAEKPGVGVGEFQNR